MDIAPISIFDVAAWQAWLEDQAARGRFLSGGSCFFGLLADFTRGEPKAVRYRLEPLMRKESGPEADRREVYRALGWEYVTTVGREFHVWRCDDPAASELDTDPEVRAAAYERLRRRLRRANWIIGGIMVLFAGTLAALYAGDPTGFWEGRVQGDRPAWLILPTYTALGLLLWQWVYGELALRRFLRTLRAGVPAPHRRPYRLARWLSVVGMAVYALYMVTMTADLFRPNNRPFVPVEELEEPVLYLALADLEGPKAIDWDNWLTREQWWVLQTDGTGYAESRYYKLRLPAMAGPLAQELGQGLKRLDAPSLDGAWWGRDGGMQTLVLRRDGTVYETHYQGGEDLRDHLDDYAALLEEDS